MITNFPFHEVQIPLPEFSFQTYLFILQILLKKSLIEDFLIRHPGNYLTKYLDEIKEKGKRILLKRKFIESANAKTYSVNRPLVNYYGNMVPEDQNKKY